MALDIVTARGGVARAVEDECCKQQHRHELLNVKKIVVILAVFAVGSIHTPITDGPAMVNHHV